MGMRIKLYVACLLAAVASPTTKADVITENMGGGDTSIVFLGQSFTTPGGGSWNNISFNFYANLPPTTPAASGTAFLLAQEYLGTPGGLSAAVAGFLATSTGVSGGKFIFDAALTLLPNTKYFLYTNAEFLASGGPAIPGEAAYFSPGSGTNFATAEIPNTNNLQSANFTLEGTSLAAVPEPSSLALALSGVGLVGLAVARRKRVGAASVKG